MSYRPLKEEKYFFQYSGGGKFRINGVKLEKSDYNARDNRRGKDSFFSTLSGVSRPPFEKS